MEGKNFARSPQGSRAYGTCPDGRGKNVTIIEAMSTEGIIATMTFTGGTNKSVFETYVTQVLGKSTFAQALKKAKKVRSPIQPSNTVEQAVDRVIGSLWVLIAKQGDVSSAM
ncbi:hypothetical protein [Dendronalium sp. ChiSLP03b]|uniref:hypothetical protein n=1 Tax=Dendronalium sp. ChiSLP03b TaxID=3075381 RepID=UPI002AD4BB91|nr:hypothetical protein [Dendronalium sp. ChiSLP03b]MDZ8206444.1 hypothetical protein [Dendronalium sp. ChiSLP03b]